MHTTYPLAITKCLECNKDAHCKQYMDSFFCVCNKDFYGNGLKCDDQCGKRSVTDVQSNQRDPSPSMYKRIVGGQNATLNDWPWMANIRYGNSFPHCGGSILSDQFVLSAAHCNINTMQKVFVGDWHIHKDRVEREYMLQNIPLIEP